MKKNSRIMIIACVTGLLLCACVKKQDTFLLEQALTEETEEEIHTPDAETKMETAGEEHEQTVSQEASVCFVHICGAVKNPGVYEVPGESRIRDVIRAAGGLTGEAAGDYVNQAQLVCDGSRIVIPTLTEVETQALFEESEQKTQTAKEDGKININRATKSELCEITGVGESRAQSILNYRETNGEFKNIEEIMNVEGIKQGMFEKIKDLITVN